MKSHGRFLRTGIATVVLGAAGSLAAAAPPEPPSLHWAFRAPVRSKLPKLRDPDLARWVRNPIDAFAAARMERADTRPLPPADRRTLLRRVTFTLTGLPPSPEEVTAFLNDPSPRAYEKVVDRLLASPRYGERWAQHWLDVVRFAETNGFELDADRPQAWRYRDYVVNALNADCPYDRFLQEQIAGDELDPSSDELAVATGFLRAGPQHVVGGNGDPAVDRQEWLTEAIAGIGAVMGVTVGCARCHDHKFDPLPQRDYYRLQAFLAGSANTDQPRFTEGEKALREKALQAHRARLAPLTLQIGAIEQPYRARLRQAKLERLDPAYRAALDTPVEKRTPDQKRMAAEAQVQLNVTWDEVVAVLTPEDRERRAGLRRRLHALELEEPPPLRIAPAVTNALIPIPKTFTLIRGEVHQRGEEVRPGFPAALGGGEPVAAENGSGRRLSLARWLTRPSNPLTARVMVNRVWQEHFGYGLVATPNDFGRHGEPPLDAALLDWLATTFSARVPKPGAGAGEQGLGWSLKRLHRLIVTSAAYRQSSRPAPPSAAGTLRLNPRPRRLDAEAMRDGILAVSGTLNPEAGGPSIRVPLAPEVYETIFTEGEPDNLWPVHPDPRQHDRRSLYLLRKRNVRLPLLAVFDQPDMMTSCGARLRSVHALQSLTLLNSDFMRRQSEALARRLLREPTRDEDSRLCRLFELTLARPPRMKEAEATRRFLRDQVALLQSALRRGEPISVLPDAPDGTDPATAAAWVDLCLATLNRNDFVWLE